MFKMNSGFAFNGTKVRLYNKRILITGATGKVGQTFISRLLADTSLTRFSTRALCHKRRLPEAPRVEVINGSIDDRKLVTEA